MTPSQKLAKIKRIYDARRRWRDGLMVCTHAADNLTGAIIDLERTGKLDATIRRTLRRVEKQLREIGKILGV